jgi:hypothetical protein
MKNLLDYNYQSGFVYPVYDPGAAVFSVARDWGLTGTNDLDLALAQPYKIACVRALFNEPHEFGYDPALQINFDQFDLVLVSDIEYSSIATIRSWLEKNGIRNWLIALGGIVDRENFDAGSMLYRYHWASQYTLRDSYTDTRGPSKPFLFDVLLGARRPHRDFVMLALDHEKLLNTSIVTYRDIFLGNVVNHQSEEFANMYPDVKLKFPYVSPHLNPDWEVLPELKNNISYLVPTEIYKRCYYSVIAETLGTGWTFFFSEKSAKAMFAGRLFVAFSNANYLKNLRELGFETFGDVIDESYDSDVLDFSRFSRTVDQLKQLAKQDPQTVLTKIDAKLEHNRQQLGTMIINSRTQMIKLLQSRTPVHCWSH